MFANDVKYIWKICLFIAVTWQCFKKEEYLNLHRHHAFSYRAENFKLIQPSPVPSTFRELRQEYLTNRTSNRAISLSWRIQLAPKFTARESVVLWASNIRCVNVISCLPRVMSLTCTCNGRGEGGYRPCASNARPLLANENRERRIETFLKPRRGKKSTKDRHSLANSLAALLYRQTHFCRQPAYWQF